MANRIFNFGKTEGETFIKSLYITISDLELRASFERGWAFDKLTENRRPTPQETEWYYDDLRAHQRRIHEIETMEGNEHLDALCHHYEIYLDKSINRYVMVINGGEYIYYPLPSGRKLYKVSN